MYGLWATGAHDERNEELIERALTELPAQLDSLTGGELAKLSFSLMQQDAGHSGMFEAIAEAAKDSMHEMFPRDIAKLVYSLSDSNIGRDVLAEPLAQQVDLHLTGFTRNVRSRRSHTALGIASCNPLEQAKTTRSLAL